MGNIDLVDPYDIAPVVASEAGSADIEREATALAGALAAPLPQVSG
jgi:hypothetical protein